MRELEFHPVAEAFRLLDQRELDELAEDIGKHGQRVPIVLLDGQILEGRNRYLACCVADVKPETVAYEGETDLDSLVAFVRSMNEMRRHDNASQRAMAGAKLKELYEADAKARSRKNLKYSGESSTGPKEPVDRSAAKAAAASGSSESSVKRAAKVIKEATPEVVKAVESGKLSVSKAAAELPKKEKPEPPAKLKQGKPVLDVREFDALKKTVGHIAPAVDKLAKKCPGDKFVRDIHNALDVVVKRLDEWKFAGRQQ